ncbi:TRAP transporter large permease [Seohaeicola zhoushanensis]|uniref:TRAP transporter large permease protein n=1 Tax=Seohaeicola zhoushanensis TaxID=1569283 RepID=A0A8J3GWU3_9RHOB|nr:TRAP transporter large permease [Seohaeicola zhoushanensis]GHF49422.1 C4-dicarboxylate ABC transporter permease [Seohaeicola zhoushanensis]
MTDALLSGFAAIGGMILLAAFGIPIAFSIGIVGAIGLYTTGGATFLWVMVQSLPYSVASEYSFAVIPMFVLMGTIAAYSGIISELYTAVNRWMEGVRGGLLMATTMASAGFAAISGSTIVNAAMFTRIALPEVIARGYHKGLSAGVIAAAGTFAALIPPSLTFVIFGILTEQSIGKLFMAGILPGLLTAACYLIAIPVIARLRPDWIPRSTARSTLREKVLGLRGIWPMLVLVFIVLGGIYSGITPPTTAGALGATGALAIALLRRRISAGKIWVSMRETAELTAVLFVLIIAGLLFSRFLVLSGFVSDLTALVTGSGLSAGGFILLMVMMYFLLGMFIDPLSMLVMTVPFVFPVIQAYGMDPIWFGVILCKMIEIGVITPPVGLNLFAVVSASEGKVSIGEIYLGILPFILVELLVLLLLILVPEISTFLPENMM